MFPNRFILDTNIWISYFLNGTLDHFFNQALKKKLKIFTSDALIDELKEVIERRKISKYLIAPSKEYIDFHKNSCTRIKHVKTFYQGLPDADDNFLIDLALEAKASFIVTGDKKLLEVKRVLGVQFISLNSFEKKLE